MFPRYVSCSPKTMTKTLPIPSDGRRGVQWKRGLWRLWIVGAVIWFALGTANIYSQYLADMNNVHDICSWHKSAAEQQACFNNLEPEVVKEHLTMWALSVTFIFLIPPLFLFVSTVVRWIKKGFLPTPR